MSSKLITFFILITIESIVRSQTNDWCQEPWQKLNEDICLEINSNIRPWSHAKLQCKYDGGELLYINNEEEQKTISDFFKQIIRYRFNLRTLVWLNLVKQSNDEWIWSQSNETLGYRNWNSNNPSGNANCACLKLKSKQTVKEDDWSWLSCDCNFSEHFVCRKPNPNSIVIKNKETTTTPKPPANIPMPIEAREQKSVDMNNEIKSIIVSTKVLNDQEDVATSQSVESKNVRLLEELKKQTHFIRNSSLFINVYRTKILKTSILFTVEECPFGFGYYSVGKQSPPDCSQYKICENWDNKFAIIHLNKCADGKNFSFKDFLCVDVKSEPCTEENFRHFVPL